MARQTALVMAKVVMSYSTVCSIVMFCSSTAESKSDEAVACQMFVSSYHSCCNAVALLIVL